MLASYVTPKNNPLLDLYHASLITDKELLCAKGMGFESGLGNVLITFITLSFFFFFFNIVFLFFRLLNTKKIKDHTNKYIYFFTL